MTEKNIKARIVHKHDLEFNWNLAGNFVPKQGELIIYDIEVDSDGNTLTLPEGRTTPYTYERFKIGDGTTLVNDLPFYACSWNDLLDRPFGYEAEVETPLTVERTFTDWCLLTNATDSWSTLSDAHSDGCIVKVYYDDEVYLCTAETGGSGFILVSDTELPFTATEAVAGSDGSVKFTALDGGTHTVFLTRVDAEVVKVPEEYIPDTIARISDFITNEAIDTICEANIEAVDLDGGLF